MIAPSWESEFQFDRFAPRILFAISRCGGARGALFAALIILTARRSPRVGSVVTRIRVLMLNRSTSMAVFLSSKYMCAPVAVLVTSTRNTGDVAGRRKCIFKLPKMFAMGVDLVTSKTA